MQTTTIIVRLLLFHGMWNISILTCTISVVVIESAICNKPAAISCQRQLMTQLNGPSNVDMTNAVELRTFLVNEMRTSIDRMATMCSSISVMFACFGTIQLDACLDADALIRDGILDVDAAYTWSSTIAQIRFSCGTAGFYGQWVFIWVYCIYWFSRTKWIWLFRACNAFA